MPKPLQGLVNHFASHASSHPTRVTPQNGRTFIITNGATGPGYYMTKSLYRAGATLYIFSHPKAAALTAISSIRQDVLNSTPPMRAGDSEPPILRVGKLRAVECDLENLESVKGAVEWFLERESGVHGVVHVLGNMRAGDGMEGHGGESEEIGLFLLMKLLLPVFARTARRCDKGSVRLIWSLWNPQGSRGRTLRSQIRPGAKHDTSQHMEKEKNVLLLAHGFAKRYAHSTGIVSVMQGAGLSHTSGRAALSRLLRYSSCGRSVPLEDRVCRMLWEAMNTRVTTEATGVCVLRSERTPQWLRLRPGSSEGKQLATGKENSVIGEAETFWEWCEEAVEDYA
ncbi:hypothetical protein CC78DRAFT_106 [Lojkania enalia]|uniref:NAD(P)-binding protein n=1 Tax=Lojkania enalia TaxID=147567 RepID=A0A9P4ND05_9PLEO|nr:hypothetical protein CC78DRAFT_106 [Didymosphaeria enalia]